MTFSTAKTKKKRADAQERKFYVYVLYRDVCLTDPFYVGKGHGYRFQEHDRLKERGKRINRHKNNTIRQCLKNFGFVPKSIFLDGLTEQEAFDLERRLISRWGRRDKDTGCLTNMTDGGEGTSGCIYTPEQRARNSVARRGKTGPEKSLSTCEKISIALTGKPKSESHKQALSRALAGRAPPPLAAIRSREINTGRPVSQETRDLISLRLSNRERSPEHCAAISRAKAGHKQAPEIIARQVASRAITMAGRPGPNTGRVFSEEVRQKMSISGKLRWERLRKERAAKK
jgi:hypothetical protein